MLTDPAAPVPAPEDIGEMLDVFQKAAWMFLRRPQAVNHFEREAESDERHRTHKDLHAARSEIRALVSRLRSQVERMTGELEAAEQHVTILREQLRADVLTPEEARIVCQYLDGKQERSAANYATAQTANAKLRRLSQSRAMREK